MWEKVVLVVCFRSSSIHAKRECRLHLHLFSFHFFAQFWSRHVVAIPMVLCATSPSCTTTATTPTVHPRDGGTTWSGVGPLRTTMLTRSLGSVPWLVRLRAIKGLWSTSLWFFELESEDLSVVGQTLMTSNELCLSLKPFKGFLKFCFVPFFPSDHF